MPRTCMAALLAIGTAQAQKPAEPASEERLALEAARRSAIELGCAEPQLSPAGRTQIPPVALGQASAILHFAVRNCTRQNVLVMAAPGQPLRAMALLPGGTAGDPMLQRDAVRPALALAAGRLNNCQAARITDTRVTQPGRTEAGRVVSAWVEEWVATGCGSTLRIQVTLTPSPGGGTGYSLRAGG